MSKKNSLGRRAAVGAIQGTSRVVGRPRAVRMVRLASNVLRFDEGQINSNGESLVQRIALTRPDPVVFDVGSNVGQWSTELLAQPGHRPTLHMFEPSSFTHAKAVTAMGDRAEVHQLALSSEIGEAELQVVKDGDTMNSLVPIGYNKTITATETVRIDTVDHFCEEHGIPEVTLLKVDAEGHDLSVVQGARGMLGRGTIGIVQFEYNWRWVDSRTYLRDVFDLVKELPRYTVAKVAPKGAEFYVGWHPELETFRMSNFLLVRDDWRAAFPAIETWWRR